MNDEEVNERLVWIRDELAPALDAALEALGGIDARALMTEALRRGDELHSRNAAATSMLAERLAPALDVDATPRRRIFDVLRDNSQFFVGVSLAATRLSLDAGHGVEGERGDDGRRERARLRDQILRPRRPLVRRAGRSARGLRR
jgi:hypothetical protein